MSNDCCRRNWEEYNHFKGIFGTNTELRMSILKEFINNQKPSIDVGCGSYSPFYLKTTHACDDSSLAKKYLAKLGWKGIFKKANVIKLPYKDKEFKVAVCSEVIEHLTSELNVRKAFEELDRISERWIVTTPSTIIDDPDHKLFFTGDHLFDIIPFEKSYYTIIRKGIYFYISTDIVFLWKILEVKF